MLKYLFACLVSLAFSAAPSSASATHKSWLLKSPGTGCVFNSPNSSEEHAAASWNYSTSSRFITCPVAIAGRWGNSDVTPNVVGYNDPGWARAMSANIYVLNGKPGTGLSCTLRARLGTGSQQDFLFFSRTVTTTVGGESTLALAKSSSWGPGTLETNEALPVRSMDFECNIPGVGSSGPSGVFAHKVRLCQHKVNCDDEEGANNHELNVRSKQGPGVTSWGENFVQTHGIECGSTSDLVERSETGITNTDTTPRWITCPISPPADDSAEHNDRNITALKVFYAGTAAPNCQQNQTCPDCVLVWRDRASGNAVFTSNQFPWKNDQYTPGYLRLPGPTEAAQINLAQEDSIVVRCLVPAGQTLKGITAKLSVTAVSQAD